MLDKIQDQSLREIHDIVREDLVSKRGEGHPTVVLFDTCVEMLAEQEKEIGLEMFLQSRWDRINKDN